MDWSEKQKKLDHELKGASGNKVRSPSSCCILTHSSLQWSALHPQDVALRAIPMPGAMPRVLTLDHCESIMQNL